MNGSRSILTDCAGAHKEPPRIITTTACTRMIPILCRQVSLVWGFRYNSRNHKVRGEYDNTAKPEKLASGRFFDGALGADLHACSWTMDEGPGQRNPAGARWKTESRRAGSPVVRRPPGPVGNLGIQRRVQPEPCERPQTCRCSISALGKGTRG